MLKGVVVVAFKKMLTIDVIKQLSSRAVSYSAAAVDVAQND
jgi:hypothetical protein